MKARVKFAKYGAMRYVGHLDLMRFFQKAMRRAGIDVAFTEGFSPHMVMSFALPLGIGATSEAEYLDIALRKKVPSEEAVERLNRVMVEGVDVQSFREIPEGRASNCMTLVSAARYEIWAKGLPAPTPSEVARFCDAGQILAAMGEKEKARTADIRPLIYQMGAGEGCLDLTLAAGSRANLRPEVVLGAFLQFLGHGDFRGIAQTHRKELYARSGDSLISLEELGKDIGP